MSRTGNDEKTKNEKKKNTLWKWLVGLATPSDQILDDTFSLYEATLERKRQKQQKSGQGEKSGEGQSGSRQGQRGDRGQGSDRDQQPSDNGRQGKHGKKQGGGAEGKGGRQRKGRFVRPLTVEELKQKAEEEEAKEDLEDYRADDPNDLPKPIDRSLDVNLARLKKVFRIPRNKDFVLREFTISQEHPVRAAIIFIDGMADKNIIDWAVLQPLMLLAELPPGAEEGEPLAGDALKRDVFALVHQQLVPINQVSIAKKLPDAVKGVLTGASAVLVDGSDQILVVETKGWEHRGVSEPKQEQVVRGPHEAFNETLRANTAMVRRRLKTPSLVTEFAEIGRLSHTDVAIMYLDGITNPALLDEVRRRLKAIKADYVGDSGIIEQFIEDAPYSIYPSLLSTERPDRVVSFLAEGHVALIVNNNPYALVIPGTFVGLMHTAEDANLRWPVGSFVRVVRTVSYFVALFFPALYIAVTNYHAETIPTDLALAIAGSRETVPFPIVVEVILMAFSFELLTEASTRVPGVIGPTIGIVGAVVLGQAAVQAAIISPILVIVISITALAAFAIPNYNLANSLRLLRYAYILAAATLGFYGIGILFFVDYVHLATQRSFGVPLLAPIAPDKGGAGDVVLRQPVFTMEQRPRYTQPKDQMRQPELIRRWSPSAKQLTGRTGPEGGGAKSGKGKKTESGGKRGQQRGS